MTWDEIEDRKDEIRKNLPKINFDKIDPITPRDKRGVEEITKSSCIRPDIYLNNERFCNGCPWFEHCICGIKKISKKDIVITRKKR